MNYGEVILLILELLGGVGLFLYGMSLMGNSLEKLAGGGLEKLLEKLTTSKTKGVGSMKGWGLGTGVTAIIQSSAATTIMLIGFVNAGIMGLSQAIPVVFGANLGSTATSLILSLGDIGGGALILQILKPKYLACILLVIGAFMILFAKKKLKDIAGIMVGLGVLFTGMVTMESVFSDNENVVEIIRHLFMTIKNPLVAFLIGLAITAIIQSSSASVGILQALSATGAITYGVAIPIIIGENIGKCATIILGSIGANKKAKRVSASYLLFNIFGAILFMILFLVMQNVFQMSVFGATVNRSKIAVVHVGFNLITSLLLLPFADKMKAITGKLVGEDEESREDAKFAVLDKMLLNTPVVALQQCKNVMVSMADAVYYNYKMSCQLIEEYSEDVAEKMDKNEHFIDKCESTLSAYILKINSKSLSSDDRRVVSELLNSISDLERIGDRAINIRFITEEMHENKIIFSESGSQDMKVLMEALDTVMNTTFFAFKADDETSAIRVEPLVNIISKMSNAIKDNHVERLSNGTCNVEAGMKLIDILGNFQRMASHCDNVALHVTKRLNKELHLDDMHGHIMDKHSEAYKELYNYYKNEYYDKIKKKCNL